MNHLNLLSYCTALVLLAGSLSAQTPITINPAAVTRHGPEQGTLLIIGGNVGSNEAIWKKFTALAGGADKAVVLVVTAAVGEAAGTDQADIAEVKKQTGIKNVTLLHPANLAEANSEKFTDAIRKATAIYFVGGRQWRIADAYLNTLAHQAFFDLLGRGGVIAGSSAGATIQGSFLWRGDTRGAEVLVGDHTQGLGFLKNSVIDQHLLVRNRQFDLVNLVKFSPGLIGLGLDEATAVVVHRDTLEVIGKSYVAVYDYDSMNGSRGTARSDSANTRAAIPFFFLHAGQRYDLKNRRIIPTGPANKPVPGME